jgi:hypothetical protein
VRVYQFDKKAARAPKNGAKKNGALTKTPGTLPRRVITAPGMFHDGVIITAAGNIEQGRKTKGTDG